MTVELGTSHKKKRAADIDRQLQGCCMRKGPTEASIPMISWLRMNHHPFSGSFGAVSCLEQGLSIANIELHVYTNKLALKYIFNCYFSTSTSSFSPGEYHIV